MENNTPLNSTTEEIDLLEVLKKIWRNRRMICKVALIFFILGIFIAIFSPKQYTAKCLMIVQTSEGGVKIGGGLGGLAAMAGVNLGDVGKSTEMLSPNIYPKVLASVPFQKELMKMSLRVEGQDTLVTLKEYYTNKKYQKFNLLSTISTYTIGLPGVIIGLLKKDAQEPFVANRFPNEVAIQTLTKDESKCIATLKEKVKLTIQSKDTEYIELQVTMPEAYVSAQLAEHVVQLLEKYVTKFKIEKVQSNLDFVLERHNEAKQEFENIQAARAQFYDANEKLVSAKATVEQEKWDTQYDLAFSVYQELAKQIEQNRIKVKETTPILIVVDPVVVPREKSNTSSVAIVFAFVFLGVLAGSGMVYLLPLLTVLSGNEKWKNKVAA